MALESIDSAFLAAVEARVIHGYLLDRVAAGAQDPLLIVELDARTGRFGYHLVQRLLQRCERFQARGQRPFVYVMTTHDRATLERWRDDPRLAGLVERGVFDIARTTPERFSAGQEHLELEHTGVALSAENRAESLVLVANGIFSRTAQPLFYAEAGQLFRCTAARAEGEDADRDAAALAAYQLSPIDPAAAFPDPTWNRILESYVERLDGTALSLPVAAFACAARVRQLAQHGMFLCTDLGYVHERALHQRPLPAAAAAHRQVNFNALAEFVLRTGGSVLAPPGQGARLVVMAALHGETRVPPLETVRAYYDAVADAFGPDEWHTLRPLVESSLAHASSEELLAYIGWCEWDEHAFIRAAPHLLTRVQEGELAADTREAIVHMAHLVWARHHPELARAPIASSAPDDSAMTVPDMAFAMAVLCFGLDRYDEARTYFAHSLELQGESAAVHYNLALCAAQLGARDRALEHLDRALALDQDFTAALDMRLRVMAGM